MYKYIQVPTRIHPLIKLKYLQILVISNSAHSREIRLQIQMILIHGHYSFNRIDQPRLALSSPPPHLSEKMLGTAIYRLYNIATFPLTNKNLFPPNVNFFDKDHSYIDPSDHIANSRSFLKIILKVGLLTFFSKK